MNWPIGSIVKVETVKRLYTVEVRADGSYISGHPMICPYPRRWPWAFEEWGNGCMRLEYGPYVSSPIKRITVELPSDNDLRRRLDVLIATDAEEGTEAHSKRE